MKNPVAVGEELLHAIEDSHQRRMLVPWDEFYLHVGETGAFVTEDYMTRMNRVLQPKGFCSFKSSDGVMVKSIK